MTLSPPEPWSAPPWELAVVVRYNEFDATEPEQRIALMRAFASPDEADDEAARLNAVAARQGQSTRYFVSILYQRER